ncbi:thioredoxin [Phage NC-G]|nr:thioredoxin [Phage NC-G]
MTRNEYIKAFTAYITTNTPPLTPYEVIVSNISKWVDQIDEDLSRCFKSEIEKIAGRLFISDIIETFKGSRLLSRLVNKDLLSGFGKGKYCGTSHVNYQWFGDVLKSYIKIKGADPKGLFPLRWAGEFHTNSALILKAAAKTFVKGVCRTNHPIAPQMIKACAKNGKVHISIIWSPSWKPKDEAEVSKYQDISYNTLNTVEQALALMHTVEKYEIQEIKHPLGWKGYEALVTVREIKCPVPKTDAEIYQEKCEEIVNTDKEPATLEDLIDELNSPRLLVPTPITKSKPPEVVALEKAYKDALAINKKLTAQYTAAKKLWEESTNRLDRLEQALELLK